MAISPLAGKLAPSELLIDIAKAERLYYEKPDIHDLSKRVSFGTSGHRGSSLNGTFTESHVLAITQAICDYRRANQISGPLFIGKDTHLLSSPAQRSALEVLVANEVEAIIQSENGFTPTPVISRAILAHNSSQKERLADGIVITPSHNPPEDGGFKYNPPNGGPADTEITKWIQDRANVLLVQGGSGIKRVEINAATRTQFINAQDLVSPYVDDLKNVINMDAIKGAQFKIGVDPLGGSSVLYWDAINSVYGTAIAVVSKKVDSAFSFMNVDHDGKIRMDCSSPYAMAGLIQIKDDFKVAFATDPDADRHGIVTPSGLMNPNHYLAVAIRYLLDHRESWAESLVVGKTLVSSSLIDRVVASLNRKLWEVPVGFKWFVPKLFDSTCCFGGEESAGATFLRKDGSAWTTDKDGIILSLLAAEITAVTGKEPGQHFAELAAEFGMPYYNRVDAPISATQKDKLKNITSSAVKAGTLAGDPITAKLSNAPGNQAPIGGLKVVTQNGWFAARPSGTEDIYKIYAESFKDEAHLEAITREAQIIVDSVLST